jgi:nicotinamide phosphoribosyltransferase
MGGALLQQMNRDTQKFALKCSAARIGGTWRDVYKDPVTDAGKASKRGRLMLVRSAEFDLYRTIAVPTDVETVDKAPVPAGFQPAMEVVYENGRLLCDWSFDEVRARSVRGL